MCSKNQGSKKPTALFKNVTSNLGKQGRSGSAASARNILQQIKDKKSKPPKPNPSSSQEGKTD